MSTLDRLHSFDLETFAVQGGLAAPPVVCGSYADATETHLELKIEALDWFERHIGVDPIVGAHVFYDLGCVAAARPELLPAIFRAVEDGKVLDVLLLEGLHDNARGCLYRSPTGAPIGMYSLEFLEGRYLGGLDRSEQKHGEDAWRLRYAELDGVPLEDWPAEATQYPRADARNTYDVAVQQLADYPLEDPRYRQNVQCLGGEMRAGLVLQLASIWGMRTDPLLVPVVVDQVKKQHEESRRRFFASGIVRVRPCTKKEGVYERADEISTDWLNAASAALPNTPWAEARRDDVRRAVAAIAKGVPVRFAEDKKTLAEFVARAYAGSPPTTEKGGVSTSRDTLSESGDPLLEAYAEEGENEKLLSTYVSVLEQGTQVPINPRTKILLETDRVSYSKPNLQQLPRGSDDQNEALWAGGVE